jgi:TolB-like protein
VPRGGNDAGSRRSGRRSRGATWALLGIGVFAAAFFVLLRVSMPRASPAPLRSVAILPFQAMTPSPSQEELGLALADAVITRVGRTGRRAVRPTEAVRAYGGSDRDPLAAGRALRVDAVLDGRVQESGDRIRISVQLVRVDLPVPIWSESFEASRADLSAIEAAIAEAVASRLDPGAVTPSD